MTAAQKANKKKYMSDETFRELELSLNQAVEYAQGERNDLRVTTLAAPPQPHPRTRKKIIAIRQRLNYSQSTFARALNVSLKTVQAWEQGTRKPSDAALKLLAIAEKHPEVLLDSQ
jgi:putative transcriptional regulator